MSAHWGLPHKAFPQITESYIKNILQELAHRNDMSFQKQKQYKETVSHSHLLGDFFQPQLQHIGQIRSLPNSIAVPFPC